MFVSSRVFRPSTLSATGGYPRCSVRHSSTPVDLGDPQVCPDCVSYKAPRYLETPIPVVHEGCPIYSGYSEDPTSPGYVAGSIPCSTLENLHPEDKDKVNSIDPAFTGHWSGNDSAGNRQRWDIDAAFTGFVRNKAFEDWNNQCVQVVKYTHTVSGKTANTYEAGMFLIDWKFGMTYTNKPRLISVAGEDLSTKPPPPDFSRHFAHTSGDSTNVVIINPKDSGLLTNILPSDPLSALKVTTVAGTALLKELKALPDAKTACSFFWEVNGGSKITRAGGAAPPPKTALPITPVNNMSFALAVRGETMYTYALNVPGSSDGLVTLTRKSKKASSQQVKKTVSAPVVLSATSSERDVWDNLINKLPGNWESKHAETLAVSMPPHFIRSKDAIAAHFSPTGDNKKAINKLKQFTSDLLRELIGGGIVLPNGKVVAQKPGDLDIFTLCSHSNIKDFFRIWTNPLSTPDLVILNYSQAINVFTSEKSEKGPGVHEEDGFFIFDWANKRISRHATIPHGSTFEMDGSLPKFSTSPLPFLHVSTLPHFGPGFKMPFSGKNADEFLSGVQPGPKGEVFQNNQTVQLHNPAKLLYDVNQLTDSQLKWITTMALNSGNSVDLPFVDKLSRRGDEKYPKFVNDISSNFYLSEFNSLAPRLQYVQVIHFDFPVRGTPDIDPSKDNYSAKKVVRWPHVIVSNLRQTE